VILKSLAPTVLKISIVKKLTAVANTRKLPNHRRNVCTEPQRQAAQKYFSISIILYSAQYFKLPQRTSWWRYTSWSQQCYHKFIDMNDHFALGGGSIAGKAPLSVNGLIPFTKQDLSVITQLQDQNICLLDASQVKGKEERMNELNYNSL